MKLSNFLSKNVRSIIFKSIFFLLIFSLIFSIHVFGISKFIESSNSLGYIPQQNDYYLKTLATVDQELFKAFNSPEREIHLLLRKCEVYLEMGDLSNASRILELVNKSKKTIFNNLCAIDFLYAMNKGLLMEMTCQVNESQKWLEKAQIFLKSENSIPEKDAARLYNALGNIRYEFMDSANAINYYLMSLSRNIGNSRTEKVTKLNYLSNLQLAAYYFNRLDLVKWAKSQSDSLFAELGDLDTPELLTYFLNLTAIYLNKEYNLILAKKTMDQAAYILQKYHKIGFYQFGLLYFFQGQYAYLMGDYEKALGYLKESENYLIKHPVLTVSMYQIYFLLANVYFFYKKDYMLAIQNYEKVQQSKSPWIKTNLIYSFLLNGYSYFALGDTERAIAYTRKGLDISKKRPSWSSGDAQAYSFLCLSGIYKKLGNKDDAYKYLTEAYVTSLKHSMANDLNATILRDMGSHFKNEGDYMQALRNYQQALIVCSKYFSDTSIFVNPVITEIPTEKLIIETLNMKAFALYLLFEKGGADIRYLEAALQCQEISLKFCEKRIIDMDNENSEFNLIDLIKVSYNNAISFATMLYYLSGNLSYFDRSFQYAEKSKMLVMLINNHKKNTREYAGIPDSLIEKEILLRNEILNLQNRLYNVEGYGISSSMKQVLLERLAFAQLERDQLTSVFERSYKRYFDLKYNLNVLNIYQIQAQLKRDQVLIEYQLLSSELIIIIIAKNILKVHLIPLNGNEKEQIFNFRESVSGNPMKKDLYIVFNEFTQNSHYLYNWLIEPIKNEIKNKRLIIVPHNELNLIPFELLITELPNTESSSNYKNLKYLFLECPISYAYSGTLLFDTQIDQKSINKVAFFLPEYSNISKQFEKEFDGLASLDGAKEEVMAAKKLTDGDLFDGILANETFFKLEAPKYKVIHIASHTKLDNLIPTLSSLILTTISDSVNDGLLHSYEIYQLNLKAQLVVLSGCNTGFGRLQFGEGLLSLARSFFYTGVRSVIYTLWPTPDKISANIITVFYKEMSHGKSLDDALQNAKKSILFSCDPAKSHPYYWSGYVVVGKTYPIQVHNMLPIAFLMTTCFILGVICLWIYIKFKFLVCE